MKRLFFKTALAAFFTTPLLLSQAFTANALTADNAHMKCCKECHDTCSHEGKKSCHCSCECSRCHHSDRVGK